ncbi:MAG: folylpolyglutamate synthase/dihydrofolate synthase family protein [Phycisphaerales bacterium]
MPKSNAAPKRSPRAAADPAPDVKADPAASPPVPPLRASDIENYTLALKYLGERTNLERLRPGALGPGAFALDRMRALLTRLGDPQNDVRFVHIAGSKGKGSTVEMTASCLAACGFATGVYTSPHLIDVRERIRINAECIGYAHFARLCQKVAGAAEAVEKQHGAASYFEVLTAIALCYFQEQAVDIAVIEVGIGGRLDATNLIRPEVAAIAAIQLEHTQLLGDTLAKIAREKAGILKPGVPALTIPQDPSVMEVLREVAARVGAPLDVVGETIEFSCRFEASPELGPHARVCLTTPRSTFEHLPVPLKGEHQAINCGLALAILDRLRGRGFETPERHVAEGLARTRTDGRMELAWRSPRILVDGAHTPDSVGALIRAIGAHIRYDSMVVIFGCAADKDLRGILARLATGADKIIFTRAQGNQRAADPRELARRFAELSHKMAQSARTFPDALKLAKGAVGKGDLILVTGSFYLAGEAKKHLAEVAARDTVAEPKPRPQSPGLVPPPPQPSPPAPVQRPAR